MTDIFISYTEENQHQAQLLSQALEQQGFSVWWNKDAPEGQLFNNHADEALQEAKCVVVIWSQFSVSDRWINSVAREASERGNLLPALFEDVFVPVEFREIQTANLIGWKGETSDTFFQDMAMQINKLIQSSHDPGDIDPPSESASPSATPDTIISGDQAEVFDMPEVSGNPISEVEDSEIKLDPEEEAKSPGGETEALEDSIASQEASLKEELRTSSEGDSPIEELVKEVNNEAEELSELRMEESVEELDPSDQADIPQSVNFEDEIGQEIEPAYVDAAPLSDHEFQAENQEHLSEPGMEVNEISEKPKQPKLLIYGGLTAAVLVVLWAIFQVVPDDKESIDQVQTLDVSPQLPAATPPPETIEGTETTEPSMEDTEAIDWDAALEKNDIAAYETYQENYPQGNHLTQAKEKIAALKSEETVQAPAVPAQSKSIATNVASSNSRPKRYASVNEGNFFTTKTLTKGPMRPGEPNQEFQVGERVYLWATISTPAYERVKLEWLTSDDRLIAEKYVNIAKDLGNGFNIHDWKQNFPGTTGQFKARLYNSNQEKIAETVFRIN
ncbi:MAG: toll/interleukin-1 receptor domain-containing protein [Cyclobacteriaceae bacterium]